MYIDPQLKGNGILYFTFEVEIGGEYSLFPRRVPTVGCHCVKVAKNSGGLFCDPRGPISYQKWAFYISY